MAAFNKFNCFARDLGDKVHDLQATGDMLKVYLTNNTPDPALDSVKADLAGITEQFGYAPEDVQQDWDFESSGLASLTGVDVVFTAVGGSFGPFRYAVLYNDSPVSPEDPLIGWWDYGSSITVLVGESFTVDFGVIILTVE